MAAFRLWLSVSVDGIQGLFTRARRLVSGISPPRESSRFFACQWTRSRGEIARLAANLVAHKAPISSREIPSGVILGDGAPGQKRRWRRHDRWLFSRVPRTVIEKSAHRLANSSKRRAVTSPEICGFFSCTEVSRAEREAVAEDLADITTNLLEIETGLHLTAVPAGASGESQNFFRACFYPEQSHGSSHRAEFT